MGNLSKDFPFFVSNLMKGNNMYLNNPICAEPEKRAVLYCIDKNLEFNNVTAMKIIMDVCKGQPILWTIGKHIVDITRDVAWEYSGSKVAIERVQAKIAATKLLWAEQRFIANIATDKLQSKPDLDKLVDALYQFNIVDGSSYLALVYFLMQLKYTRGKQEMPKNRSDQRIALFLNGIQGSGKSSLVKALIAVEENYGLINNVNSAGTFENRFEENLWKAHLNFCDEVVPSRIAREVLIKAIDGGNYQLEHKNQTPYNYNVNTNLIFASNDDISLKQRRVAVMKFGGRIKKNIPFETLCGWMGTIMDSLPDFYWHSDMYWSVSGVNQTRLNPLGLETISEFLATKLGYFAPDDDERTVKFNTAQIYNMIKEKHNKEFLKTDRKEAIRDALESLVEMGYLERFTYTGGTTKQYTMNIKQYYKFSEWANSINTSDEKLTKISKRELRDLLKPYFEPVPPNNAGVILLPAPTELLELPAPSTAEKIDVFPATNPIKELSIDLETFSDVDLKKRGVYKYVESPDFDILLFAYSINGGGVQVVDLARGEKIPENVLKALTDKSVIKWAFNASFERVCLSAWLRKVHPDYFKGYETNEKALQNYLDPTSWRCSQIWANYLGYPLSLKSVGAELHLKEQKMAEGKKLINYFCIPCKPTLKNGMRTRNLPEHNLANWEIFKQYNKRDVEVEMAIKEKFRLETVPVSIWEQYEIDQKINDRGVKIDLVLAKNATEINSNNTLVIYSELKSLTGIKNPNSGSQLKKWLATQGIITENIDKKVINQLLLDHPTGIVADALKMKQQLSKSSVSKYTTMLSTACNDSRARGCLQFYGAFTTGRWAGRYIQLQNLPKNYLVDLDAARKAVIDLNYSKIKKTFNIAGKDSSGGKILTPVIVSDGLSQLIRTALIPEENHKFIVADYSAIEARVLAVIAHEPWRIKAFKSGEDIYCASASKMFGVPVVKNGVNGELRSKGKVAELALGYGGAEGALINMGALSMGLKEDELPDLVKSWRNANPRITSFWSDCGIAAKRAITTKQTCCAGNIRFFCPGNTLYIVLPSGRSLVYRDVQIIRDEHGYEVISYRGSRDTKTTEIATHGAKLVENIIQGISRDILAYALQNLTQYRVVAHVHDEVIVEVPKDIPVSTITGIMEQTPSWIQGLPLKAEGYECPYYQKQ